MTEVPFKISVPEELITRLKQKLAATRFPDELEDAEWDYGVPLPAMRRLVARWKDGYDWRRHEAALNEDLPQFTRDIEVDGHGALNVHYVHKKSEVDGAIPLLFVHGWPGSFIEVRKVLPLLVQGPANHPAFHVVAVGLPGYGFSEAPKKKGFSIDQFAEVGHKLMLALGYNEYVTQGGDWGYMITCHIAALYGQKHAKAWHTNLPIATPPTLTTKPLAYLSSLFSKSLTINEQEGVRRGKWYQDKSSGYFKLQTTQPQTLGYSLADSPAGMLAWIYEKLVQWSDAYPWEDDEVLTWISIYWFSRAGPAASVRIYCEHTRANLSIFTTTPPTNILTGISYFPRELVGYPRKWLRSSNLIFEAEHDSGGHFAAYEKPQELVDDLRKMFGKGSRAFGVVSGKTGFVQ
ncbi:hypothetical protein D9613_005925 [Agrocybe pediades]|uniref:Epoxide hydrolase N-terminal domain-containing protein n=1 Tax=Agrocybe pediades TaxID=84607 RepID=A0A8H4QV03_9AGAR|nr:hypothetical protein D9613_005925 [Agrocybe pediades]